MPTPSDSSIAGTTSPDVTVVVIGYNDARRLPTAVQSVLDQTLHNLEIVIVDDASTDGTAAVAREFAARHPDRVRAISLPENSGGCSRPRNVGIDAARGTYVMFLDSDDTLERHAAKNLLLAAERTGADLVSGVCVRVNITKNNRRTRWYARLYAEHATYEGIREAQELLFDTLCTNKIYRRAFLDDNRIRFPDGLHYEDLLFTTEAYCSARRIAVLPVEVYRWHVVEDADAASISNRREKIANFRDRLEIHRRIDAYLTAHGFDDLKPIKDRKFIHQDLRLYLTDLALREPEYQSAWIALAGEYMQTVSEEVVAGAGPLAAATAYLVRQGDLDEALHAAELWIHGRLSGRLHLRDGRAYLSDRHLDDALGRRLLDVTALHLHDAPFSRRNLRNALVALKGDRQSVELQGEINNPIGDLGDSDQLSAALELRTIDGRHRVRIGDTRLDVRTPHTLTWATTLTGHHRPPRTPPRVVLWELWMTLHRGDSINVSQVITRPNRFEGTDLPWKTARWTGRRTLRLEVAASYGVRARLHRPALVSVSVRVWSRVRRSGLYGDIRRVLTLPVSRPVKALVYRTVFVRLPIRRGTAVFESQMGRTFGDSPKYVYRALRAAGHTQRVVWSYAGSTAGWPTDAALVKRGSWRYVYELARAEYWVDNQGLPSILTPRPGTRYLQTWHGSPYKAMGHDQPQLQFGPAELRRQFVRDVERWTDFCVQSEFADETFHRAFAHKARSLRVGYPRNDPLLQHSASEVKDLYARLELPDDRRIVLYAPTFRDSQRITRGRADLPLNLAQMSELVGDRCYLLVRAHYLDRGNVAARYSNFARDVSDHPDMTELLLVADALITDYSSVMFDYALLRRPMLFYAYDLELYNQTRGSYFDLETEAPGPVVRAQEDVITWLADPDAAHATYTERMEQFVQKFCTYETGHAAEQAVAQVFGTFR